METINDALNKYPNGYLEDDVEEEYLEEFSNMTRDIMLDLDGDETTSEEYYKNLILQMEGMKKAICSLLQFDILDVSDIIWKNTIIKKTDGRFYDGEEEKNAFCYKGMIRQDKDTGLTGILNLNSEYPYSMETLWVTSNFISKS